jgi:hypothetical protein
MQDIGVIGDIRAIQDKRATREIGGIRDKRATPAIEARPHHAPPDSIAILTPIQEKWIACGTKQHQALHGERGETINTNAISLINVSKRYLRKLKRSANLLSSRGFLCISGSADPVLGVRGSSRDEFSPLNL